MTHKIHFQIDGYVDLDMSEYETIDEWAILTALVDWYMTARDSELADALSYGNGPEVMGISEE